MSKHAGEIDYTIGRSVQVLLDSVENQTQLIWDAASDLEELLVSSIQDAPDLINTLQEQLETIAGRLDSLLTPQND
jgi:hypothetical protein